MNTSNLKPSRSLVTAALSLILVLLVSACSSNSAPVVPAPATSAPIMDISGNWFAVITLGVSGETATDSGDTMIIQDGNSLTMGAMTGSIRGNSVEFSGVSDDSTINLSGTASENAITLSGGGNIYSDGDSYPYTMSMDMSRSSGASVQFSTQSADLESPEIEKLEEKVIDLLN